jgi:uncharacterized protein YifE (UPF0438 family)
MRFRGFCEDNNITIVSENNVSYKDKHGNAFETLTSGGRKKQGERTPALYSTEEQAWGEFEDCFLVWLNGRRRVHFRAVPALHEVVLFSDPTDEDCHERYYVVMCRLTAY